MSWAERKVLGPAKKVKEILRERKPGVGRTIQTV